MSTNEIIIDCLDKMFNNYEEAIKRAYKEDDEMCDIFRGRAQGCYEAMRIGLGGEGVAWDSDAEAQNE